MITFFSALLFGQKTEEVRSPAVAGLFYPEDPTTLTQMIDRYLSQAQVVITGEIGGLVSPHAGYVYSGPVAAWSYKQLIGKHYDYVVVIAPSHFEYFPGCSIFPGKAYATPLGEIPIAKDLATELTEESDRIYFSERGHHVLGQGRGEHSLEVQLPFLQRVLDNFQLVPIVVADQSWNNIKILGEALARVLKGKNALIVASSDLSHYHSYSTAYEMDKPIQEYFQKFKYEDLIYACEDHTIEACGYGPIAAMLYACSLMGYNKSKVLKYATSGDIPGGDKAQVVGYMSGVVYR